MTTTKTDTQRQLDQAYDTLRAMVMTSGRYHKSVIAAQEAHIETLKALDAAETEIARLKAELGSIPVFGLDCNYIAQWNTVCSKCARKHNPAMLHADYIALRAQLAGGVIVPREGTKDWIAKYKHDLCVEIDRIITRSGLSQTQVADILGTTQPRVSRLVSARVADFSIEILWAYRAMLTAAQEKE